MTQRCDHSSRISHLPSTRSATHIAHIYPLINYHYVANSLNCLQNVSIAVCVCARQLISTRAAPKAPSTTDNNNKTSHTAIDDHNKIKCRTRWTPSNVSALNTRTEGKMCGVRGNFAHTKSHEAMRWAVREWEHRTSDKERISRARSKALNHLS